MDDSIEQNDSGILSMSTLLFLVYVFEPVNVPTASTSSERVLTRKRKAEEPIERTNAKKHHVDAVSTSTTVTKKSKYSRPRDRCSA